MNNTQRLGGAGALLFGLSFLLLIVSNAVIQPGLGLNGAADQMDPGKVFPHAAALRLLFAIPILFAIAVSLVTVGLRDRLERHAPAPVQLATAGGWAGAILFLAAGMFAFVGLPEIADSYARNPAGFTAADLAVANGVADGLTTAAIFAAGWWVLLASWVALRATALPTILNYLGLLFGIVAILTFALPPLGLVGALVGLVWAIWLGAVLLRAPASQVAAIAPAGSAP